MERIENGKEELKDRVCVIIPVYNEASTIGEVVRKAKRQGVDIIVIDDGSQDSTNAVASESQALVFANPVNKGKGFSLRLGFKHAINNGYKAIITMDGDGQHSPEDIGIFLYSGEGKGDIIVGNRMGAPGNMPFIRFITNRLMSGIISWLCFQNIPDSQNGFRLIKTSCLKSLNLRSNRFEIESEILIEAARSGYKIASVPIRSLYKNNRSQINPISDTIKFIKFVLPYFFKRLFLIH